MDKKADFDNQNKQTTTDHSDSRRSVLCQMCLRKLLRIEHPDRTSCVKDEVALRSTPWSRIISTHVSIDVIFQTSKMPNVKLPENE